MNLKPIIDFDSIIYKCAWKNDLEQALSKGQSYIDVIEERFSNKAEVFLSGDVNFRYIVDPNYKIKRKDKPKPPFYYEIRDHFIGLGAHVSSGYEADDEVGIRAAPDVVVCGIDKDLNTIPGAHYNYDKGTFYEISEDEAARTFWEQVISGDTTDNIKGLPGLGIVKAAELLEGIDVKDYRKTVEAKYLEILGSDGFLEFDKTARLVFIKRISLETEYYHIYP